MNRRHAQVVDTIEEKRGRASENAQVDVTPEKQDSPDLMAIIKRYCGSDILDGRDWRYLSDVLEELIAQRVAAEREAILAAIDDLDEPAWYGYENPWRFDDGKRACEKAIRSRAKEPTYRPGCRASA